LNVTLTAVSFRSNFAIALESFPSRHSNRGVHFVVEFTLLGSAPRDSKRAVIYNIKYVIRLDWIGLDHIRLD